MNFRDEMVFSRGQSDRTLAPLLIQLEEVEEKIDGLQRSRLELIEKILSQWKQKAPMQQGRSGVIFKTRWKVRVH